MKWLQLEIHAFQKIIIKAKSNPFVSSFSSYSFQIEKMHLELYISISKHDFSLEFNKIVQY